MRKEKQKRTEKKRKEKKVKEKTRQETKDKREETKDKRQENIKEEKRTEKIRAGETRRNRQRKMLCEYFDLGFRGWRNETFHISDSLTISVICIFVFYFI